ncbi:Bug family tripartite tricarboxylate transporter substrate binding protein [Variovorax sp. LjRoot178]|uniref:Bug family tripartite tricarboxylate transporter substrate binding protein n=1 Tax=Variovorax sp. LjRoot178 TaxID=3342277 RepID=UPI003ECE00C2
MKTSAFIRRLCAGLGAFVLAASANAQNFSAKPIKILVGYAPGGGADLIARVYGQKLQEILGTPVVVENKPGAFEQLAAAQAVAALPDGHTLWLGTAGALTMGPGVRTNIPYDVIKSFTHVAKIGEVDAVITIGNGIPARTLPEFVAYAKANPGKLNYASAGVGSGNHLLTEYIAGVTNIKMTHVPYKGDADVVREIAAGNADFGIPTVATGTPFINDGRIKALVVTGTQRAKALPNVPSVSEDGGVEELKGYGVYSIYALLGPAGMPPAVTQALTEALGKISRMPDVAQKLEAGSVRASYSTPSELKQYIEKEVAKWKEVGKKVKID